MEQQNSQPLQTSQPQKQKLTRLDWLLLLGWLLIIITVVLLAYYFSVAEINQCTADPFSYGVNLIKENTGANLVYGVVHFTREDGAKGSESFGDFNITEFLKDK